LLSPSATGFVGYVELVGEWKQEELPILRGILYNQSEPDIVYDVNGQPAGFFVKAGYEQVLRSLQSVLLDLNLD
jgi:hypothetical protein